MKEKETEVKVLSAREAISDLLLELEVASNDMNAISEHFETITDQMDLDGSNECYYMLGFVAGFKHARNIESDLNNLAIVLSSRKANGDS